MAGAAGRERLAFGVYVGSTVHEVAQVVVAGRAVSELAASQAVITKMIRVMMLAPFLIAVSALLARRGAAEGEEGAGRRRIVVPWFALGFVAMAGVRSADLLPQALLAPLLQAGNLVLAMAMGALGLTTHVSAVRRAGARPLLLAALLFAWLVIGGLAVNGLVGGWWR
ncbi:MAG: putative sulfate exporter family transporter [Burkholderiaceae bacterium]